MSWYQQELLNTQKTELLKTIGLELVLVLPFHTQGVLDFQMDHFEYFSRYFLAFYITSCYRGDF